MLEDFPFFGLWGIVASTLSSHTPGCGNPVEASYQGPDVPKDMCQGSTISSPTTEENIGEMWSQRKKGGTQVVGQSSGEYHAAAKGGGCSVWRWGGTVNDMLSEKASLRSVQTFTEREKAGKTQNIWFRNTYMVKKHFKKCKEIFIKT